ncbi:MAG: RraA family protein [Chloroflexi bacterium]|jgi:regulator of RNase E activity RraA|nr:RraA family protein [Chloroflexota bacterium]
MNRESVLTKLASFDTPTVCNVIELFEIRPRNAGYVKDATIHCNYPAMPPIVGYAATSVARSTYAPTRDDSASYSWLEEQIERFNELSGPPIVVIEDLDTPKIAAMFGEIMCTSYKIFGAKGLITNGAGRDIGQVEAMGGFQLYTNGEISSHAYFQLVDLYLPVEIGGLIIHTDDLLHADRNGITQIPKEIASEVADACDVFLESERIFLEVINKPNVSLKQFKEARAASKAMQKQLRDQLARV